MNSTLKTGLVWFLLLVVGFFIGVEYQSYRVRTAVLEGLSGLSSIHSGVADTADKNTQEYNYIEKKIGDVIEMGTVKFTVNSAKESDTVVGMFNRATEAGEGNKFVVIDVDMENITDAPFTFYDENLAVMDDQERKYKAQDGMGNIENYISARELSPNIAENGMAFFRVPADATGIKLGLPKKGTTDVYLVDLGE